jgi:hypothetical protein
MIQFLNQQIEFYLIKIFFNLTMKMIFHLDLVNSEIPKSSVYVVFWVHKLSLLQLYVYFLGKIVYQNSILKLLFRSII